MSRIAARFAELKAKNHGEGSVMADTAIARAIVVALGEKIAE